MPPILFCAVIAALDGFRPKPVFYRAITQQKTGGPKAVYTLGYIHVDMLLFFISIYYLLDTDNKFYNTVINERGDQYC